MNDSIRGDSGSTAGWLGGLVEQLKRVCSGDRSVQFKLEGEDPAFRQAEVFLNQLAGQLRDQTGRTEQEHQALEEIRRSLVSSVGVLKAVGGGDFSARVDDTVLKSSNPAIRELGEAINSTVGGMKERLDLAERVDTYHESTMELALGLSESFSVLDAMRSGNLEARVSDEMLNSSDELVAQLARAINATAQDQMETIMRQQQAIQELSTPVLRLWDNILALPIVGIVDSTRTADIMDRLLSEIVSTQSKCVILDITGVDVVDTRTADNFIKMVKAAELVGARCVLTGISPAVAQTLVDIGVNMGSIVTLRNLQDGLRECIRYLEARRTAQRAAAGGNRPSGPA